MAIHELALDVDLFANLDVVGVIRGSGRWVTQSRYGAK